MNSEDTEQAEVVSAKTVVHRAFLLHEHNTTADDDPLHLTCLQIYTSSRLSTSTLSSHRHRDLCQWTIRGSKVASSLFKFPAQFIAKTLHTWYLHCTGNARGTPEHARGNKRKVSEHTNVVSDTVLLILRDALCDPSDVSNFLYQPSAWGSGRRALRL